MLGHFSKSNSRFLFPALILLVVTLTTLLAACAPKATPQADVPTDKCGPIEPNDQDVKNVLSFGKDAFASKDWVRSYTVEPYKVSLSRINETENAVAYTEYLIYTCGYTQTDLNNYFNDAGFNVVFSGYESHNMANFCEKKKLAFYIFDLAKDGTEYTAHYWVKQDTDTRILVAMLVFPKSSSAKLDEYSKKLFPELTSCP